MKNTPIILASGSPRRRELLAEVGLKFKVIPSDAEEIHSENLTGRELAEINAYRKVRRTAAANPRALVIGADTLVCLGAEVFGKPANLTAARRMLARFQGRTHQVVTGVCLLHEKVGWLKIFSEITDVKFRRLNARQIREYLAAINPLDKAGAYAIQEQGARIISGISGSRSNVVGLPVERLEKELAGRVLFRKPVTPRKS